MTHDRMQHNQRYLITVQQAGMSLTATIRYADESREIPVEIRDISATGAGLLTTEPPRLRSAVIVSLFDGSHWVRTRATVRWTRPVSDGVWCIGCVFIGRFESHLSARDTDPDRRTTKIAVRISRQLRGQERVHGHIVRVSDGGICLRSRSPYAVGDNLLIERDADDGKTQFIVQVHWQQSEDDCFLTGCQFAGPVAIEELGASEDQSVGIVRPKEVFTGDRQAIAKTPPGIWAACSLVYGWSALHMAGCWPPGL